MPRHQKDFFLGLVEARSGSAYPAMGGMNNLRCRPLFIGSRQVPTDNAGSEKTSCSAVHAAVYERITIASNDARFVIAFDCPKDSFGELAPPRRQS